MDRGYKRAVNGGSDLHEEKTDESTECMFNVCTHSDQMKGKFTPTF